MDKKKIEKAVRQILEAIGEAVESLVAAQVGKNRSFDHVVTLDEKVI